MTRIRRFVLDRGHHANAMEVVSQQLNATKAGIVNLSTPEHLQPAIPDASTGGDLLDRRLGGLQARLDVLQTVHYEQHSEKVFAPQGTDFSPDNRHTQGVDDYRKMFRDNLLAALEAAGTTPKKVKAYYLDGPREGKRVSGRTIELIRKNKPKASSPTLDLVVALAEALGVKPWMLLVPGFDPKRPLLAIPEDEIERRTVQRAIELAQVFQKQLEQLSNGTAGRLPDPGSLVDRPSTGEGSVDDQS